MTRNSEQVKVELELVIGECLQRALGLNRQFLPALDELLALTADDPPRRNAVLVTLAAPWLELIARARELYADMGATAQAERLARDS